MSRSPFAGLFVDEVPCVTGAGPPSKLVIADSYLPGVTSSAGLVKASESGHARTERFSFWDKLRENWMEHEVHMPSDPRSHRDHDRLGRP